MFLIGLKIFLGQSGDNKNNNSRIISYPRWPQHLTHSFPLSSSFLPWSCVILTSSLKRPLKPLTFTSLPHTLPSSQNDVFLSVHLEKNLMSFNATLISASVKLPPISLSLCPLSPNSLMSCMPNSLAHLLKLVVKNDLPQWAVNTSSVPHCIPPWIFAGNIQDRAVDSQPNQWLLVSPLPDFLILGICNFHLLPSPATVDIYPLTPSLSIDLYNFLCMDLQSLQEKRKRNTVYWAPNVFQVLHSVF